MAFESENEIGIKPVTDYTLEELQIAYGRIHQQMEMLTLRFDMLQKIAEDTDEERNYLHQQRKDFLEATKFNAENFDYGQVYGPGSLEWCWQEMEKAHTERMKQNIMCAVKRDHFKANICVCKLYKLKSK
jgi:hypothetical protein